MTLPINFYPLINAIELTILSGSGVNSTYTIPTGSYSMDWWYENRAQEGLAQDTLTRPQIRVKINSFKDSNAWLKPNTKTMYDVNIGVEVAYHLDSKILRNKRTEIETKVANDSVIVQNALAYPQNLLTSSLGPTGLVSGRLTFDGYINPKFDYSNSVATAQINFTGKVALSNSNGV